eukprot:Nk52_evm45s296 gene=Nk52_evmTU45s296
MSYCHPVLHLDPGGEGERGLGGDSWDHGIEEWICMDPNEWPASRIETGKGVGKGIEGCGERGGDFKSAAAKGNKEDEGILVDEQQQEKQQQQKVMMEVMVREAWEIIQKSSNCGNYQYGTCRGYGRDDVSVLKEVLKVIEDNSQSLSQKLTSDRISAVKRKISNSCDQLLLKQDEPIEDTEEKNLAWGLREEPMGYSNENGEWKGEGQRKSKQSIPDCIDSSVLKGLEEFVLKFSQEGPATSETGSVRKISRPSPSSKRINRENMRSNKKAQGNGEEKMNLQRKPGKKKTVRKTLLNFFTLKKKHTTKAKAANERLQCLSAIRIQSLIRGHLIRLKLKKNIKKQFIVKELFETEQSYVRALKNVDMWYIKPLSVQAGKDSEHKNINITLSDVDKIFSTAPSILEIHLGLLKQIGTRVEKWNNDEIIGDVFDNMEECKDIYLKYISNFEMACDCLNEAKSNPAFKRFLDEKKQFHNMKESLNDLLIAPVQRIPRYELLIQQLIKYTPLAHPDHAHLQRALNTVTNIAGFINTRKGAKDQLKQLQGRLSGYIGDPLACPERYLVLSCEAIEVRAYRGSTIGKASSKLVSKKKSAVRRHLFLMNDSLMCCRAPTKSKGVYQFKWRANIRDIDVNEISSQDSADCLNVMKRKSAVFANPSYSNVVQGISRKDSQPSQVGMFKRRMSNDGGSGHSRQHSRKLSIYDESDSDDGIMVTDNIYPMQVVLWKTSGYSKFTFFLKSEKDVKSWMDQIKELKDSILVNQSRSVKAKVVRQPRTASKAVPMQPKRSSHRSLEDLSTIGGRNNLKERPKCAPGVSPSSSTSFDKDIASLYAHMEEVQRTITVEKRIMAGLENMKKAYTMEDQKSKGMKKKLCEFQKKYDDSVQRLATLEEDLSICKTAVKMCPP